MTEKRSIASMIIPVSVDKTTAIVKSSLENINSLLKVGGYPKSTICGLYGPSGSAKSIFCWQEVFFFLSQSKQNVLYFGTEGGEEMYPQLWFQRWKERFNLKDTDLERIRVLSIRDIQKILDLHGYQVRIKRAFSGKVDLLTTGQTLSKREKDPLKGVWLSDIEHYVLDNNIGLIVYDSITNPIDLEFAGGGYLDFPARAGIVSKWLNSLQRMTSMFDILILTVHHHSVRPGSEPDISILRDMPQIKGGEITEYNLKITMYLQKSILGESEEIPVLSELRRMYLVRFFDEPKWSRSVPLMINDTGVYDLTEQELKEIRHKAEETKHARRKLK